MEKLHSITVYQLMILLVNYANSISNPEVGHLDADATISDTLHRYRREKVSISTKELERLLFACNMNDELDAFWSPTGKEPFKKFCKEALKNFNFDRKYNTITKKEDGED